MKKIYFIIILFFTLFTTLSHSAESLNYFYGKWLCIQEAATGFTWKNERWERSEFNREKWIVEILPEQNECLGTYYEKNDGVVCSEIWIFGSEKSSMSNPTYGYYNGTSENAAIFLTNYPHEIDISDDGSFSMHTASPGDPRKSTKDNPFASKQWIIATGKCEKL